MSEKKGYGAAGSGSTPANARQDALNRALAKAEADGRTPVTEATTHLVGRSREDDSWTASGWCK